MIKLLNLAASHLSRNELDEALTTALQAVTVATELSVLPPARRDPFAVSAQVMLSCAYARRKDTMAFLASRAQSLELVEKHRLGQATYQYLNHYLYIMMPEVTSIMPDVTVTLAPPNTWDMAQVSRSIRRRFPMGISRRSSSDAR